MPSSRPYSSFSIDQLKSTVAEARDAATVKKVLDELQNHRNTQAARKLVTVALQRQSQLTAQSDGTLFGNLPIQSTPPKANASTTSDKPLSVRPRSDAPKSAFVPTHEQVQAVIAFMQGKSLKIAAFAGAGKTSTLKLMASKRDGRGLYIAFNARAAKEARADFPRDVTCMTTHALAARAIRSSFGFDRNKMFGKLQTKQLTEILKFESIKLGQGFTLSGDQQSHLFLATIRRFCQEASEAVEAKHVVLPGRLTGLEPDAQLALKRWICAQASDIWAHMTDPSSDIPLGHDGYLKLWSLQKPVLEYDYILLDEAQDTNAVVLDVLSRQKCQIVYVGDKHQQIYEWRGAVNAMAKIETGLEAWLTQSFRFGQVIAEPASAILKVLGETLSIQGNPRINSRVTNNYRADAILARTNARVIAETLKAMDDGRKPFIVGGTDELEMLVADVFRLQKAQPPHHTMFFGFTSWNEVTSFAGTDEGEEMRPFVSLVEQNGPGRLWAAIKGCCSDQTQSDVSISTAHKAKGSEWKSVHISDDFLSNEGDNLPISQAEARLFYVAITRAKEVLSIEPRLLAAYTRAGSFVDETELLAAKKIKRANGTTKQHYVTPQIAQPVSHVNSASSKIDAELEPPVSVVVTPKKKSFWKRLFS